MNIVMHCLDYLEIQRERRRVEQESILNSNQTALKYA